MLKVDTVDSETRTLIEEKLESYLEITKDSNNIDETLRVISRMQMLLETYKATLLG